MHRLDVHEQGGVAQCASCTARRWDLSCGPKLLILAGVHLQHLAHRLNGPAPHVAMYLGVLHSATFAKYAVTFFNVTLHLGPGQLGP